MLEFCFRNIKIMVVFFKRSAKAVSYVYYSIGKNWFIDKNNDKVFLLDCLNANLLAFSADIWSNGSFYLNRNQFFFICKQDGIINSNYKS